MKIECPWDWKLMEREKQESVSRQSRSESLAQRTGNNGTDYSDLMD